MDKTSIRRSALSHTLPTALACSQLHLVPACRLARATLPSSPHPLSHPPLAQPRSAKALVPVAVPRSARTTHRPPGYPRPRPTGAPHRAATSADEHDGNQNPGGAGGDEAPDDAAGNGDGNIEIFAGPWRRPFPFSRVPLRPQLACMQPLSWGFSYRSLDGGAVARSLTLSRYLSPSPSFPVAYFAWPPAAPIQSPSASSASSAT